MIYHLHLTEFLSTPSARRATDLRPPAQHDHSISIHALREEGDLPLFSRQIFGRLISIHALREEGDHRKATRSHTPPGYFYPRPPRGGRPYFRREYSLHHGISIHALREEGDRWQTNCRTVDFISIHALREEGDVGSLLYLYCSPNFYPRPP